MERIKQYSFQFLAVVVMLFTAVSCEESDEWSPGTSPTADFSFEITPNTTSVNFTSITDFAESMVWDFGDGTTSTEANPAYTYAEAGTYEVTLTVTGVEGSEPAINSKRVTIADPQDPTADFTYSANPNDPFEISFTSTTTDALTFAWDFGDGGTSTEENPTYTYTAEGSYDVSLTVTGTSVTTPATVTKTVSVATEQKIQGTVIGHEGSYDGVNGLIDAAFDEDLTTYVDAPADFASTGYVGYDFGEGKAAALTSIKFAPREGLAGRLVNGEIRGSNDPSLTDYDVIYTITDEPSEGMLTEVDVDPTDTYRYIYYYTPADGYANIAELEFYGEIVDRESDGSASANLLDMNSWTVQEVSSGVTVTTDNNSINFSGVGGDNWPGSHMYQEVTVEAGTYKLNGSVVVDSVIDETWLEIFFSTVEPMEGEDYSNFDDLVFRYSTWEGSATDAGTYALEDANTSANYPDDGIFTFDSPQTFYFIVKSGSHFEYDLTLADFTFQKIE